MPERVRAFVGVLTTIVFLSIGMTLLGEGQTGWGSVVLALGAFRGAVVVKQLVTMFGPEEQPPPPTPPPAGSPPARDES